MEYFDYYTEEYEQIIRGSSKIFLYKLEPVDSQDNAIQNLSDKITVGSLNISASATQGLRRSCNIELVDFDKELIPTPNSPFWINRKFKLYIGVANSDWETSGGNIYWWSQGVFYTDNPSATTNAISISGQDKFSIFGGGLGYSQPVASFHIPFGSSAKKAIESILTYELSSGVPIDSISPLIDLELSSYKLESDIVKTGGEYFESVLISIGNMLGANIYYDLTGRLSVVKSKHTTQHTTEPPSWTFKQNDIEYLPQNISYDYQSVVNSVTVEAVDSGQNSITYTAQNKNLNSNFNIYTSIGIKSSPLIQSTIVMSQAQLRQQAEFLLEEKTRLAFNFTFQSILIPHIKEGDYIQIDDDRFNFSGEMLYVQSINISEGSASYTVGNVADLPYLNDYELDF